MRQTTRPAVRTISRAALAAFALVAVAACAKPQQGGVSYGPYEVTVPKAAFDDIVKRTRVECADPSSDSSCPSSVGQVITKNGVSGNDVKLGLCTGWLASPDIAITNSHCVPKELRKPGASCAEIMSIVFPMTPGRPLESAHCEKIIFAADIAEESGTGKNARADYAILKLSRRVERPVLPLSREGLKDGEKLEMFSVDPQSRSETRGILKVKHCEAIYGSLLLPGFVAPDFPVAMLKSCETIQGNSGSPIVSSSGKALAVGYAMLEEGKRNVADFIPNAARHERTFTKMTLAANVACMQLPDELAAGPVPAGCSKTGDSTQLFRDANEEANEQNVRAQYELWEREAPKAVRFYLKKLKGSSADPTQLEATPEIKCAGDVRAQGSGAVVNGTKATVKYQQPRWGMAVTLDETYRVVVAPVILKESEITIEVDLDGLAQGLSKGRATIRDLHTNESREINPFNLKACE